MLPIEGHVGDQCGAEIPFDAPPEADAQIADKGYGGDRFRETLTSCGGLPCIPGRANHTKPVAYGIDLRKRLNLINACSSGSRTGRASSHDITGAYTTSSVLFASPLQSYSGY